jgi:hypothetical protein
MKLRKTLSIKTIRVRFCWKQMVRRVRESERALNIRYFFITDQVEKGNAQIEHCGTDNMVGDFFTKPLQGEKFQRFRNDILGR